MVYPYLKGSSAAMTANPISTTAQADSTKTDDIITSGTSRSWLGKNGARLYSFRSLTALYKRSHMIRNDEKV